jgi:hypothetical protein
MISSGSRYHEQKIVLWKKFNWREKPYYVSENLIRKIGHKNYKQVLISKW